MGSSESDASNVIGQRCLLLCVEATCSNQLPALRTFPDLALACKEVLVNIAHGL